MQLKQWCVYLTLSGSSLLASAWVTPRLATSSWSSRRRIRPSQSSLPFPSTSPCRQQQRRLLAATLDDDKGPSTTSTTTTTTTTTDYTGKTLYQRVFYRFSPGSDVDVHNAVVVEERARFTADPNKPGYVKPTGHRTLILRDGNVEDGEIGDDFFTLTVDHDQERTHTGAGTNRELESDIATAMYLASNPTLVNSSSVLQVACGSGVAGLLGCIGAGYVSRGRGANKHDIQEDILTIANPSAGLFPEGLQMLSLTDISQEDLTEAIHNCKHAGVSPSKVSIEPLDWRTRRSNTRAVGFGAGSRPVQEYQTIVASDVAFTYPEAKELARTVANRLKPSAWYFSSSSSSSSSAGSSSSRFFAPGMDEDDYKTDTSSSSSIATVPRFIHVSPDARDEVTYLHNFLEKGYKMSVSTSYLKLEKLQFVAQTLPQQAPESALDDEELELSEFKEIHFQALIAQHHPDYAGEGSGELFFPMETGEYEARSGSTYLEPDAGRSPW